MSSTATLAPPAAPERPDPPQPPADRDSNATRHLSAGAYLDETFCLSALREIYCQPKRIVAPSYGFDSIMVLGHCLRARNTLLVRHLLIIAVLTYAAWFSVLSILIVLASLLTVHLLVTGAVVGRESIQFLRDSVQIRDAAGSHEADSTARSRQGGATAQYHRPRRLRGFRRLWLENVFAQIFGRTIGTVLIYLTFSGVALMIAAASVAIWHTNPLGKAQVGLASPLTTAGLVGAAFIIPVLARVWSQVRLRSLTPDRPPTRPRMTTRLGEIEDQNGGNTIVYSGYEPFVGSGIVLRHWNFAQRLVRRPRQLPGLAVQTEEDREFQSPPFSTYEICNHVRDYIDNLANAVLPEWKLPSLTVQDRVFVAGTEIEELRPYTTPMRMAEIVRNPTAPQRHYLVCQVVSWRGELVTTVYVHFAAQGKALYVELHVAGLLPCDERFRIVDQVDGTGLKATLREAGRALITAPAAVAEAPTNLVRILRDMLAVGFRTRPAKRRIRRGYDYGAVIGLRELGASVEVKDHMQTQDIVKYGRIIERRVLAAILDFLEKRDVDVTEYRQRSLTILNAGAVATSGGTVIVEGDAIGQNIDSEGSE
jgi:hypothetical protein